MRVLTCEQSAVLVLKMSILKYFKPVPKTSDELLKELPDPNGTLSKTVPPLAIKLANDEVSKAVEGVPGMTTAKPRGTHSRPNDYLILTPAQRFEVGKRAAEHGVTASLRYFARKYPHLPLKEASVRRFKNLYQSEVKKNLWKPVASTSSTITDPAAVATEIQELPRMKTGRPLLLPEKLDSQVQEYIRELRKRGATVSTAVVVATARGIIMNKDANLLYSNGGGIKLSDEWAKSLLNRMGYVKRKACSKAKVDVEHFERLKKEFLTDIKNIVVMDEIPPDLIINFDQTGINYVPISSWTMEKEGAKRIEMVAKDDKRQITAVFAGSLSGDFLPPQLIYEGKTTRCLPCFQFPPTWNVTYTANHWSNEGTVKEHIERVILPYISKKKKELKLPDEQSALLIFDNFKAQCTSSVLTLLDSHNIDIALVPANCTDRLQPLDLSINKAVKDFLRTQFKEWYAQELCSQLNEEKETEGVDLKLSVIKPLGAKWMVAAHDHIKNNPDLVKNGFKEAGISDCLQFTITN